MYRYQSNQKVVVLSLVSSCLFAKTESSPILKQLYKKSLRLLYIETDTLLCSVFWI